MTDAELMMAVFDRLTLREAEAKAAGNRKQIVALAKAHKRLEKVAADLFAPMGMDPIAFSGGVKP